MSPPLLHARQSRELAQREFLAAGPVPTGIGPRLLCAIGERQCRQGSASRGQTRPAETSPSPRQPGNLPRHSGNGGPGGLEHTLTAQPVRLANPQEAGIENIEKNRGLVNLSEPDPPPDVNAPAAGGTAAGAKEQATDHQGSRTEDYTGDGAAASESVPLILAAAARDGLAALASVRPAWAAELGAAFSIEHGAGDPGTVPALTDLREAARLWAAFASPLEIGAFASATLDRLPDTASTSRMRRKALAAIWRRCTEAERAAFLGWAAPERVAA